MTVSTGLFRGAAELRTERYEPAHPAPDAPPELRGAGALTGTWIACEEPGAAEGWLRSGIELVMDSTLEPGAVIGRHDHRETEELYLVLGGRLTVTASVGEAAPQVREFGVGDVHRLPPGGWHSARAGEVGARIIVIAARVDR
jgi:uncharacterized RmlC-like cupin family protein